MEKKSRRTIAFTQSEIREALGQLNALICHLDENENAELHGSRRERAAHWLNTLEIRLWRIHRSSVAKG